MKVIYYVDVIWNNINNISLVMIGNNKEQIRKYLVREYGELHKVSWEMHKYSSVEEARANEWTASHSKVVDLRGGDPNDIFTQTYI